MTAKSFGRALSLALFSVSLAACGGSADRVAQSDVEGPQSKAFYEARQWSAAWNEDLAAKLQEALANAPAHGLRPEMFLASPLPEDSGARDIALTRAALLYAAALASGNVDPKSLGLPYTIPRPKPGLAAGLNQALANGNLAGWLESLAPQTEEYRALSKAYLQARQAGRADQARPLAVGLERLRWAERDPPATRIDVNTAATVLDYWRDGQHAGRRRVVTGEPGWETPQLQSPIVRLVAHPIWRVPDSIWEDELAEKGPAYYAANHMEFRDGKLVQLPGPKNALGEVKFDMENDQSIYLHDTPAKALFGEAERHRSHGCIRVEGAVDFAMQLASEQGVLPELQKGLAKGDESFIKLKQPIPVRLLYRTAYLDGGTVRIVPDVYGWDDAVAAALGLGAVPPRPKHEHRKGVDVGP